MSFIPFPAGIIFHFAGATAPSGWLKCDGSAVSRTTYASLFAVIGTDYGAGNGTTTFNVPDMRQRFIIGVAASGTGSSRAGTGGAIDHTHTVPGLSVPGLSVPGLDISGAGLSVNGTSDATSVSGTTDVEPNGDDTIVSAGSAVTVSQNAHTHTFSAGTHTHHINIAGSLGPGQSTGTGTTGTGTTGTGTSGATNPPFIACHAIIKT